MLTFLFRLLLPLATFPGIPVHEAAHVLCCHLTGTRVIEVAFLRLGMPPGYVLHAPPASPWRHALIAGGPFLVNSLAGLAAGLAAFALPLSGGTRLLVLWLAVSVATHAFPSLQDATGLLEALWSRRGGWIARILLTPLGAVMVLGSFGAMYLMLDLAWGLALGGLLPWHLVRTGWLRAFGI